jgi:hypothetical protein
MVGTAVELEHGVVGEIRHVGEPRNRRHGRAAAGGDHEFARGNARRTGFDQLAPDEPGARGHDVYAEPRETLDRIVGGDRGDLRAHMVAHGRIIHAARDLQAEAACIARGADRACRRDQRLGRHAAGVEAVAAHFVRFDEHHVEAELGSTRGHRQAAGARSDHADVGGDVVHGALRPLNFL